MEFGLSFDCSLSFTEIVEQLNQIGPWAWRDRDSAWYGNLASARTESLRLDVIESGPNEVPGGRVDAGNGQQFAISVRGRSEHPLPEQEWATLEASVRTELLPRLGASNVQPTDTID